MRNKLCEKSVSGPQTRACAWFTRFTFTLDLARVLFKEKQGQNTGGDSNVNMGQSKLTRKSAILDNQPPKHQHNIQINRIQFIKKKKKKEFIHCDQSMCDNKHVNINFNNFRLNFVFLITNLNISKNFDDEFLFVWLNQIRTVGIFLIHWIDTFVSKAINIQISL